MEGPGIRHAPPHNYRETNLARRAFLTRSAVATARAISAEAPRSASAAEKTAMTGFR